MLFFKSFNLLPIKAYNYKDIIQTITASLGVVALNEHGPDITKMINFADDALYLAKK